MLTTSESRNSIVNNVNYPKSSLYYGSYRNYINAEIKIILDVSMPRGLILRKEKLTEHDVYINGVYIPGTSDVEYIKNRIFTPFTDEYIFNDARNSGADILGDHYLQYKTEKGSDCVVNPDGTYHIPKYDINEHGELTTRRFRIIPHPGHKCIADLMKWGHCYKFDYSTNTWVYDDDKRNHLVKYLKGYLKIRIADIVGDNEERISDYSKMIYWLMLQNKDKLTEEQAAIVERFAPTSEQLTKILTRDTFVYDTIDKVLNEDVPDHYEFEL